MTPQVRDAAAKPQGTWKAIFSRISRTLLVLLGLLNFFGTVYGQFEGHADFWELSLLEALFWGAFLFLSARLYNQAMRVRAPFARLLYLPLRNLGFVTLVWVLISIATIPFLLDIESGKVNSGLFYTQQNLDQAISLVTILLCVYFAGRTLRKDAISRPSDTRKNEVLEN